MKDREIIENALQGAKEAEAILAGLDRQQLYAQRKADFEKWDKEAKEILESQIKDPAVLAAALDNSEYKRQVLEEILNPSTERSRNANDRIAEVSANLDEIRKNIALYERASQIITLSIRLFVLIFGLCAMAYAAWSALALNSMPALTSHSGADPVPGKPATGHPEFQR